MCGFALDRLLCLSLPPSKVDSAIRIAGAILIVAGMTLVPTGMRNFARAGTPVPTNRPTRSLVTTGIHGLTRNPIYLGFFMVYAGVGLATKSPSLLMLGLPLMIVIRYGVVAREEAYLERRFGDVYRDYKRRVGRWA